MRSRRAARECVLQALYASVLGGDDAVHVFATVVEPRLRHDADALEFGSMLFEQTLEIAEEADQIIESHAVNWDLGRMAHIDRIVLRMALCELLRFETIPPKVTINEAIDIVKRFSTERSGQFVNGILDAAVYELRERGQLHKTGRGLVGMESLREQQSQKER